MELDQRDWLVFAVPLVLGILQWLGWLYEFVFWLTAMVPWIDDDVPMVFNWLGLVSMNTLRATWTTFLAGVTTIIFFAANIGLNLLSFLSEPLFNEILWVPIIFYFDRGFIDRPWERQQLDEEHPWLASFRRTAVYFFQSWYEFFLLWQLDRLQVESMLRSTLASFLAVPTVAVAPDDFSVYSPNRFWSFQLARTFEQGDLVNWFQQLPIMVLFQFSLAVILYLMAQEGLYDMYRNRNVQVNPTDLPGGRPAETPGDRLAVADRLDRPTARLADAPVIRRVLGYEGTAIQLLTFTAYQLSFVPITYARVLVAIINEQMNPTQAQGWQYEGQTWQYLASMERFFIGLGSAIVIILTQVLIRVLCKKVVKMVYYCSGNWSTELAHWDGPYQGDDMDAAAVNEARRIHELRDDMLYRRDIFFDWLDGHLNLHPLLARRLLMLTFWNVVSGLDNQGEFERFRIVFNWLVTHYAGILPNNELPGINPA